MSGSTFIPKFSILFNIVTGAMTVTDISSNRSVNTRGIFKITNITDGIIIYQHASWLASPLSWVSPDVNGSTPVWAITKDMLDAQNVEWKVEYKAYDGIAPTSITAIYRSYTLDYTAPVVDHTFSISCSTSELTSTDSTDYNIEISGVEYEPTSMTRIKTLTKPAGSGCTISPLTWTDYGTVPSHTIGGGGTPGTRIWTRVWQANIVTSLLYSLATWDDDYPTVTLSDTVYGDDNTFVQCDQVICALATCYANLLTRWIAAITTNFEYKENKRDIVIQAGGLFNKLLWYERCGTDTESVIADLQELLSGENCDCTVTDDDVSAQVIPWSTVVTGGSTPSEFQFHFSAVDPTNGHNGDSWLNTTNGNIYQKAGGSWTLKGNLKGETGDAAVAVDKIKTLFNDPTERSTPASTALTAISYEFSINNSQFEYDNDYMEFTYEVRLASNQNGKTLTLRFASTDILTYFTDDLVNSNNETVEIKMRVTPTSDTTQDIIAQLIRGGQSGEVFGPIRIAHGVDLNTTRTVLLYGQNSVASASDIIGKRTMVQYFRREIVLIPPTDELAVRGLVSQSFIATEGQTTFTVTNFTATDYYLPVVDDVFQSKTLITRVGNVFTVAGGLHAGQVLTIYC